MHPAFLPRDILPRLPEPGRTRFAHENSGRGTRVVRDYPRWRNGGFRIDAAVPGGAPGSDIDVLRVQLLPSEYFREPPLRQAPQPRLSDGRPPGALVLRGPGRGILARAVAGAGPVAFPAG